MMNLDENLSLAYTSTLKTWHKGGRGVSIHPHPVMDSVIAKIKPSDEQSGKAVSCQLYEARKKKHTAEKEMCKNEVAAINPNMGMATLPPQIHPTVWCKPNLAVVLLVLQTVINCLLQSLTFLCMSI